MYDKLLNHEIDSLAFPRSYSYKDKLVKNFILLIINSQINNDNKNETNLTLRYYGIGAQIIKDLKIKKMILVSRSKKRVIGLKGYNLKITKQEIIK